MQGAQLQKYSFFLNPSDCGVEQSPRKSGWIKDNKTV